MKLLRPSLFLLLSLSLVFSGCQQEKEPKLYKGDLNIAYAEPFTSLNPYGNEAVNQRLLINLYEPLVHFDRRYNIESALAVSWGRQSDNEWDFRIRPDVQFHDGSFLDAEDVVFSIDLAREKSSGLNSQLSSIQKLEVLDAERIRITTAGPDPILLNKLTSVFIVPEDYTDFEVPIGTGPYQMAAVQEGRVDLYRYQNYWGPLPYFESVSLHVLPSIDDRLRALVEGEVQLLANVPPQAVQGLPDELEIVDFPSLEVNYLMMNLDSKLRNSALRELLWNSISNNYNELFGSGYLDATSQFAATGILGNDPSIPVREPNLERAQALRSQLPSSLSLKLDLPVGFENLAIAVQNDLVPLNIRIDAEFHSVDQYEAQILSGNSELYFFGWKYSLGDLASFYNSVLRSDGQFNGVSFANENFDALLSQANQSLDQEERRELLLELNQLLLDEKLVLPLFESNLLYALRPEIRWDYRLDGLIFASEVQGDVID